MGMSSPALSASGRYLPAQGYSLPKRRCLESSRKSLMFFMMKYSSTIAARATSAGTIYLTGGERCWNLKWNRRAETLKSMMRKMKRTIFTTSTETAA